MANVNCQFLEVRTSSSDLQTQTRGLCYFKSIQNQPSEGFEPSEGSCIEIYDLLGIKIISESINPMTSSHKINIEHLSAGTYFIKIGSRVEKFVKM